MWAICLGSSATVRQVWMVTDFITWVAGKNPDLNTISPATRMSWAPWLCVMQ